MNCVLNTSWLAPGGTAAASDVRLNGSQIVDDASFFQAASMAFYSRGNLGVNFSFTTKWLFNTPLNAEVFVLMLPSLVPLGNDSAAVLQCICGSEPNTQTVYMENAVLESVEVIEQRGLSVTVRYNIKGPGFQTDVPPDVPGYPDPDETAPVLRRASVSIANGATSVVVTFSSPFQTPPIVVPVCAGLAGSVGIFCRLVSDSVTTDGFTAELSAATTDGTYTLDYIAMQ